MIRKVVLRRFKRFEELSLDLPGHVVLAGPNNTGKTTVLQALAAWDLALRQWRAHNDFARRRGAYTKVPIARQAFSAVPLRRFDLLWRDRRMDGPLVIEVQAQQGWTLGMEILPDTTEQVLVRPLASVEPALLRAHDVALATVFVPPMTGLAVEEPLYANPEFVALRLAQGRPGEVLRNILVQAAESEPAWSALVQAIERLFGYRLVPPDKDGAHIVAEYAAPNGTRFDLASAGSGFQQVLMLLTYLHTRPGAVLLLDEPDAHLHVLLQGAIYGELRSVAARQRSQLVIATHSEVVIDSVDPDELCVLARTPRRLVTGDERRVLIRGLRLLTNTEIMLVDQAPGVLYVEDWTDVEILRAWAGVLGHRCEALLRGGLLWRRSSDGSAQTHFEALRLVRPDLRALEIVDRDGNPHLPEREAVGHGLQRLRWRRYEIESYLVHPQVLERFVALSLGPGAAPAGAQGLRDAFATLLEGAAEDFLAQPLRPSRLLEPFFERTKARTAILPPLLEAAGLPGFPYTRYHEIAACMRPDEIHPEVIEKLDDLARAFDL